MYVLIGIFLLICLLFVLLFHLKKKQIIKKIKNICECEKTALFNNLISPFGFYYLPEDDIFTSTRNAWQREFGYSFLYDETAPFVQLVFDCLPVYFNYQERTWLIELWKGQYGINTGAEIGIYRADTLISPDQYRTTLFHAISDEELPFIKLELTKNGYPLFQIEDYHWWLTGFHMGTFSQPEELMLNGAITFHTEEMMNAFLDALYHHGYCQHELKICGQTVTVPMGFECSDTSSRRIHHFHKCSYDSSHGACTSPCHRHPIRCRISQWKNRLFVLIYHWFTQPFDKTINKLLYLYFFLPPVFRRIIQPRKRKCYKKYKRLQKRNCMIANGL